MKEKIGAFVDVCVAAYPDVGSKFFVEMDNPAEPKTMPKLYDTNGESFFLEVRSGFAKDFVVFAVFENPAYAFAARRLDRHTISTGRLTFGNVGNVVDKN